LGAKDADSVPKDGTGEVEEDAVLLIDAAANLLRKSSIDEILDEADAFIDFVLDEVKDASGPPADGGSLVDVNGNASILDEVIDAYVTTNGLNCPVSQLAGQSSDCT